MLLYNLPRSYRVKQEILDLMTKIELGVLKMQEITIENIRTLELKPNEGWED